MESSLVGDKICPFQTAIRSGRADGDGPRHDWHGHGHTYNHGLRHKVSGEVGGGLASILYICTGKGVPPPLFCIKLQAICWWKSRSPPFGLDHAPYLMQKHHETRKCDGDRATGKRQRNERIMRSSTVKWVSSFFSYMIDLFCIYSTHRPWV